MTKIDFLFLLHIKSSRSTRVKRLYILRLSDINRYRRGRVKRFYKLNPKLQVRLYTTLVRPIIEYPPIPNALASKSLTLQMQREQNRALRYAVKETDDQNKTIEQMHTLFGIDALNVRLHHRMFKTWHKT